MSLKQRVERNSTTSNPRFLLMDDSKIRFGLRTMSNLFVDYITSYLNYRTEINQEIRGNGWSASQPYLYLSYLCNNFFYWTT